MSSPLTIRSKYRPRSRVSRAAATFVLWLPETIALRTPFSLSDSSRLPHSRSLGKPSGAHDALVVRLAALDERVQILFDAVFGGQPLEYVPRAGACEFAVPSLGAHLHPVWGQELEERPHVQGLRADNDAVEIEKHGF